MQKSITDTQVREHQEGHNGSDGHPQAVPFGAKIMDGQAHGNERGRDRDPFGHHGGYGGQPGAAIPFQRAAFRRRGVKGLQPHYALQSAYTIKESLNAEEPGKGSARRHFGWQRLDRGSQRRIGIGQRVFYQRLRRHDGLSCPGERHVAFTLSRACLRAKFACALGTT